MSPDDLERAVAAALTPDHFYLDRALTLRIEQRTQESLPWEVFRGHLLDKSQTREERKFASWLVFLSPEATEPILAVLFDPEVHQVFVTRSILIYGHEAYDDHGIIQSREAEKWRRELVGTIELDRVSGATQLGELLEHYLFLAVIGISRLPITSLESPLPDFTFGRFGYFPRTGDSPLRESKLLELSIRATSATDFAAAFTRRRDLDIRILFNHLALSPYTDFVPKLTRLIQERPAEQAVTDLSYLLRHLVRHLTAFDLHVFHNRGANYPDALALDLWLHAFCELIETHPVLAESMVVRRALRQAWLIRKQLEGLRVPEHPTSPGENLRVLPEPFGRLPEEQVLQADQRTLHLFANEPAEELLTPAIRRLLDHSLADLAHEAELRELGLAVFLDRPFGVFKQSGEVDRTPLFAYEAFSRTIAMSRLNAWHNLGFLPKARHAELTEKLLHGLEMKGIPVMDLPGRERPGVVALEDAIRASPDFVILRATKRTSELFQRLCLDDPPLKALALCRSAGRLFPIRSPRARLFADAEAFLTVYDDQLQPVIEFGLGQRDRGVVRYREWNGIEEITEGLRLLRYWDERGQEVVLG